MMVYDIQIIFLVVIIFYHVKYLHAINTNCFSVVSIPSGFGGLEVACWPLVPKFAASNPAETVGFLRINKNPQHVRGMDVCLL